MNEQKNAVCGLSSYYSKAFPYLFRSYRILIMNMLRKSTKEEGVSFQQLRFLEREKYITFQKISEGHKTYTLYRRNDEEKAVLKELVQQLRRILFY